VTDAVVVSRIWAASVAWKPSTSRRMSAACWRGGRSCSAFLEGSAPLGPIMRGAEIHRQWEDGGELCSFYDFKIETPAGAGSIPMAEWNSFRDGKLASARLIFDTAAMAALMPGS
jgi:hypothetical protein